MKKKCLILLGTSILVSVGAQAKADSALPGHPAPANPTATNPTASTSAPAQPVQVNPITPYYNCYMGLTAYNNLPQELVGPRVIQKRTFSWIKGAIVLRHQKANGSSGFYLAFPRTYYFVPLPATNASASYLELVTPQKQSEPSMTIHMSISPAGIQSEEMSKGFPAVTFPPGAAFVRIALYEVMDNEFYTAFASDLSKRISTLYSHYLQKKNAGQGTGAWAPNEYETELQACQEINDPTVQAAAKAELAKFNTLKPIQPPAPKAGGDLEFFDSSQEKLKALYQSPVGPYLLTMKPTIDAVAPKILRMLPEDLSKLLQLLWIPFFFLVVRILFHSYFRGVKVIKDFSRAYELTLQKNAKTPTYEGFVKNHRLEISYGALGSTKRFTQITVGLRGEMPAQLEIRLKSRKFAAIARDDGEERKTDALDDEFFAKYVEVKAKYPEEIEKFLSSWRKSIIRQSMGKMDVSIANSKLVFQRPGMFPDFENLESTIHQLLNTAVLLTPK